MSEVSTLNVEQQIDEQLLAALRESGSREAFAAIAERHLSMVYHAALRQTRDAALADDVTQAVFLLLWQKAPKLQNQTVLAGWLYNTTRYTVITAMRSQKRRENHEHRVAQQAAALSPRAPADGMEDLVPLLDSAVARLRPLHREAIVLRYFQNKPVNEISQALGVSEEAARKRITRALQELRGYFERKRISVPAEALGASMLELAAQPAPARLLEAVLGAPTPAVQALSASVSLPTTWNLVNVGSIVAAVAALVVLAVIIWPRGPQPVVANAPVEGQWPEAQLAPDASFDDFPIAPGWPRALPGTSTCTPAVADLDGDGKLEILVASRGSNDGVAHTNPVAAPLLYVLRADGTPFPGWPVELTPVQSENPPKMAGSWASSPSVVNGKDGKPRTVIAGPWNLPTLLTILSADGKVINKLRGVDATSSVPLADLDGDGSPDINSGLVISDIDGQPLAGWNNPRPLGGYSPCIGDADGDGVPEVYRITYYLPKLGAGQFSAFDITGKLIWSKPLAEPTWNGPVMGDVTGDEKMEIVGAYLGNLHVWNFDGTGVANTQTKGEFDGILVPGVQSSVAKPALADLDGDGKAEIVLFDIQTMSLRAWHGDGKPFRTDDGTIARLDQKCGGVSIGDLGDDGEWDFFCGAYWIRLPKTGDATITKLVPEPFDTNMAQPTIADVDADGQAEAIFAMPDGRIVVYQTRLSINEKQLQWPTVAGNAQHTGVWTKKK